MQLELITEIVLFIASLGPIILLPIVVFLLCMVFGVKWDTAVKAGLSFGIAFIGIFAVLDILIGALNIVVEALFAVVGARLTVIDLGWTYPYAVAVGWWGMPLSLITTIGFNLLMLVLGSKRGGTDSLSIYDMCVQCDYSFISYVFIVGLSGNLVLAFGLPLIGFYVMLRLSDWLAPLTQDPDTYAFTGMTWSHPFTGMAIKTLWIDHYILGRIPSLARSKLDPDSLRERFGIWGDPVFIAFMVAAVLGGYAFWIGAADIPGVGYLMVALPAGMLLMPRMIGVLMEGAVPFADGVRDWSEKHMGGRPFWLGMDWAIAAGNDVMIAVGILMVPICLLLALVLPGNQLIPYGDLGIAMCFALYGVCASKGNVLRTTITATFMAAVTLYLGTFYGPITTPIAAEFGMPITEGFLVTGMAYAMYIHLPILAIMGVYLLGGPVGRLFLSGEMWLGYPVVNPEFAFLFCAVYLVTDIICWWMIRDLPIRIAKTPKEEFIEKGPKSMEEVRKILAKEAK